MGESARDAALRMEQEALDARTAIRLASLRAQKDEERAIQQRAVELQKEMAIREEAGAEPRRRRKATDAEKGRAHIHRGRSVHRDVLSALALTNRAASFLVDGDSPWPTGLSSSLSVGGGVAVTATLIVSTLILFTVALKEGLGVINNTPVTFYRCDGQGPACCKNGPHNLGYAEKFTYLANGRGFETRQRDSMRRHLLVSRKCRELKPIVIYRRRRAEAL